MRARIAAAAAAALAAVAVSPARAAGTRTAGTAAANDPHQCAPQNRWCIGALRKHGRRFLEIAGFDLRGRYRVCVTAPGGARERCATFTLTANATGAHASSIAFARHFPHRRHGTYRVRWIYSGAQLGHVLSFSL